MTEVLCDVVECHSNSGGLRSTCIRKVLRLDSEEEGRTRHGKRVFIPGTTAMRCMDIDERTTLSPDGEISDERTILMGKEVRGHKHEMAQELR